MVQHVLAVALAFSSGGLQSQPASPRPQFDTFEVATIKPVGSDEGKGRYLIMRGSDTFVGKNYTLKLLIAAAYELNPREISGGPTWIDSDHFDILARTPGTVQPTHDEQMRMLRRLLTERFKLSYHRQQKVFSIYQLEIDKGGPKLKPSTAAADALPALISTVYPHHILMPARNAAMGDFVSVLQRAVLDRPVVDKTGLTGRYDFDLQWAPDETQFGGEVPVAPPDASSPPFFTAIREQLGLRLVATRGPAEALVIDHAERPSPN
ncbi:MAG TPA: TIGR03435 family protein [Terracidiphilus sp.]|nr:TIGR03435 family protein [Terracidiphilus sp.]